MTRWFELIIIHDFYERVDKMDAKYILCVPEAHNSRYYS